MSKKQRPLNDVIAEAIRGDGSDLCDQPWATLTKERKTGWLGDANRVIDRLGYELRDILEVVMAAQEFVDDLPEDDAGSKFVCDNHNGSRLEDLVSAVINMGESEPARLASALLAANKARKADQ